MTLPVIQPRSCGACDACCVIYSIDEPGLRKAQHERCAHARGADGCAVYETRPKTCRDFVCLWLKGLGAEGDRPDLSGYIMRDVPNADLAAGGAVVFSEVSDGACADGSTGYENACEVAFTVPVAINRKDGTRRLIMPSTPRAP